MAQSVSNDALWEKLKEMDNKTDNLSEVKEVIITEIRKDIHIFSLSNDSQFEANKKNIQMLNGNVLNILKEVNLIREQQKEFGEPQKADDSYFNFRFFKVRKTFFVIAILGLLVFILKHFCMKQQNDYSILMNEYHKQCISI
jgi:hypothetical protein